MISYVDHRTQDDKIIFVIFGLSTDTKPTKIGSDSVAEGSFFITEDTQEVYIMKADGSWVAFS